MFSFQDLSTGHSRKMDILSRREDGKDLLSLQNICICRVSGLLGEALLNKRNSFFPTLAQGFFLAVFWAALDSGVSEILSFGKIWAILALSFLYVFENLLSFNCNIQIIRGFCAESDT